MELDVHAVAASSAWRTVGGLRTGSLPTLPHAAAGAGHAARATDADGGIDPVVAGFVAVTRPRK